MALQVLHRRRRHPKLAGWLAGKHYHDYKCVVKYAVSVIQGMRARYLCNDDWAGPHMNV